jgi:flagellar biosynthetic protein FlhB
MALFQDQYGERTEKPTPLRLQEARRRGQVARSADLTSAALAVVGAGAIALLGGAVVDRLSAMTSAMLDGAGSGEGVPAIIQSLASCARGPVVVAGAIMLAMFVAAAAVGFAQVGPLWTSEPFSADLGRLSPSANVRKIFSGRGIVRLGMTLAKIAVIAVVLAWTFRSAMPQLASLWAAEGSQAAGAAGKLASGLAVRILGALAALAGLDYLYQRWQHRQDLKITRRELISDLRSMEGDPLNKARRKGLTKRSTEFGGNEELQRDSVVVASGAFAVAIGIGDDAEPRIVSRTRGAAAKRLCATARRMGVAVVEDETLSGALAKQAYADGIPRKYHARAAEILAYARVIASDEA